jgi:hypothetical protein
VLIDKVSTSAFTSVTGAGAAAAVGTTLRTCSIWARLSGAIASTSTPSAAGRVDRTTASAPKAWRTRASASRGVLAVKRLTFMLPPAVPSQGRHAP